MICKKKITLISLLILVAAIIFAGMVAFMQWDENRYWESTRKRNVPVLQDMAYTHAVREWNGIDILTIGLLLNHILLILKGLVK